MAKKEEAAKKENFIGKLGRFFKNLGVRIARSFKEMYAELKKVRDELRDLSVHKANYEELRDLEEREQRKAKEHGRD